MFYPKLEISFQEIRELPDQSCLTSERRNERCRRQGSNQTPFQASQSNIDNHTFSNGEENKDFKSKAKRRFFWIIWKQHSDEFASYQEFKNTCDTNIRIRSEIKKDLEKELPNLFRRTRKIVWFLSILTVKDKPLTVQKRGLSSTLWIVKTSIVFIVYIKSKKKKNNDKK